MIKIENVVSPSAYEWKAVIEGMRNPMNSWARSDTEIGSYPWDRGFYQIGENDKSLMLQLARGGGPHAKFRRMLPVYATITAPLFWWKEFDTYKIGTVANSCSTMHKIHSKEFTIEDFTCDVIAKDDRVLDFFRDIIRALNTYRDLYNETKDKKYWRTMIELLPSSYMQKRTVMLNYEVLAQMYKWRWNHKLGEWCHFCEWIETLPLSEIITCERED